VERANRTLGSANLAQFGVEEWDNTDENCGLVLLLLQSAFFDTRLLLRGRFSGQKQDAKVGIIIGKF
jgi:hypothetical protein